MDNSTFNILQHQFYINENNNELYIITGPRNIKFSEYLENIIMEKNLLELEEFITNMKDELIYLLPDMTKKAYYVINKLTIF